MTRFKEWIGFIAAVLSIGAIGLSAYNHFRVDELREFYNVVKPLKLEISLSQPVDSAEVSNCVTGISGHVRIQPTETSPVGTDINMTLGEREIEIVPFVRPLANFLWYPQTRPTITPDGVLTGSVILGDKEGRGIGEDFQVVLLAVRAGEIRPGYPLPDLPQHGCASNTVTVKRTQ